MLSAALVLLLAQTCVAEIDLHTDGVEECVVMWSINLATAERRDVTLRVQTLAYNAYWDRRNRKHRDRRPWIAQLAGVGEPAPAAWPSRRSWSNAVPKWHAYLAAAAAFVELSRSGAFEPLRCGLYGRRSRHRYEPEQYGGFVLDGAPCRAARRLSCLSGSERQAYWNTRPCRTARRRARASGATIPAHIAAGGNRLRRAR